MNKYNIDQLNRLGLKTYNFPSVIEEKDQGILRIYEMDQLPFIIKRVFSVMNAFSGAKRGQHAHKKCNQLLCCVSGGIELTCDDGYERFSIKIYPNGESIWIPNGIWAEQNYTKNNSAIIVFCDQSYDELDYIRDYQEFLKWKRVQK